MAAPVLRLYDGFADTSPQLRDEVRELQARLRHADRGIVVDGLFGHGTEQAVRVFQHDRGLRSDGHDHVAMAVSRGAAAVVVERELPGVPVPQVIVERTADALGVLCGRALGAPAERLALVGITGTNGKTTTTYLVEAMLAHPVLINRPIVVTALGTKLCRPSETVLDILPQPQRGAFRKEDGEPVVDAAGNRIV